MNRIPDDGASQDAPEALWRPAASSRSPEASYAAAAVSDNLALLSGRRRGKSELGRLVRAYADALGLTVIDHLTPGGISPSFVIVDDVIAPWRRQVARPAPSIDPVCAGLKAQKLCRL